MREAQLLEHIYSRSADLGRRYPQIILGPGDDAAALRTPAGGVLLITVDQVLEGRHFRTGTAADRIARKAVARSVSDIAAMGGSPVWSLATGALPKGYDKADQLFDAMARWARHWGCPLVGGDIASWDDADDALAPAADSMRLVSAHGEHRPSGARLLVTCTVAGTPHAGRGPVTRSGAMPGDAVWLTGRVGNSFQSGRHLTFEPRVPEALWLCEAIGPALHAMIDLSDGLGRDAGRIAAASGVRVELHAADIPLHRDAEDLRAGLADGEDYELLFTTAPGVEVPPACPSTGTAMTRIGRVVAGAGCVCITDQGELDVSTLGWDHGEASEALPGDHS